MSTVLHLPNGRRHVVSKLRDTIATGAPHDGKQPIARFSLDEMAIIARFLDLAREDLEYQLGQTAKEPGMTKAKLAPLRQGAVLVSAWIAGIQGTIATMAEAAEQKAAQE